MSVELAAARMSESVLANRFPAILNKDSGKSVRCDDSIPGNYHCLVSVVEGKLVVWDLGTPGGTFVNGERVSKATVKPGDTLSLAGTDFQANYKQRPLRHLFGPRS
jgi:pSer/pThr/pTyr-binding forkhead associated (FHA) protein